MITAPLLVLQPAGELPFLELRKAESEARLPRNRQICGQDLGQWEWVVDADREGRRSPTVRK